MVEISTHVVTHHIWVTTWTKPIGSFCPSPTCKLELHSNQFSQQFVCTASYSRLGCARILAANTASTGCFSKFALSICISFIDFELTFLTALVYRSGLLFVMALNHHL